MQITVFGASGRVGHVVVERLLTDGHSVVAFVHKNNPFSEAANLRVVSGDSGNAAMVQSAIDGSDAVMSCLGSWGTPSKDILTKAMEALIPAMEQAGKKRLITLTGVAAFLPNETVTFFDRLNRLILKVIQPKILADGEAHLRLLTASSLDWTSVRSPVMNSKPNASYKLSHKLPAPWVKTSRASVAAAMVDQLSDSTYLRSAPALYPK